MRQFLQQLDQWLVTIQSMGNPWAVTVICIGLMLPLGLAAGPVQPGSHGFAARPWQPFRLLVRQKMADASFYGLLTLLVLRWDKWWLTGPAAVFLGQLILRSILHGLRIAVQAVPVVATRPRHAVPMSACVGIGFASDALLVIYLALMIRALVT